MCPFVLASGRVSSPTRRTLTESYQTYSQPSYQQQSEISYSVHGTQPKFEPISFLVSSSQENTRPTVRTSAMTTEDERSVTMNQYQTFGSQTRGRPTQRTGAGFGDSKQTISRDYETMETESDMQSNRFPYSTVQTSYETSRPTFTKVSSSKFLASPSHLCKSQTLETVDAVEYSTVQITVHLTTVGPQQARPEIQWFHHAQPIIADNVHYRIIDEQDTSTLEIIGLRKADAGQVWCVATTSAGSATTTCTINVNGKPSTTITLTYCIRLEMPVRTYHQGSSTQQQVVPRQSAYETQSMYSTQQTSYETSRPTFTKVSSSKLNVSSTRFYALQELEPVDAVEYSTVQITVHLTTVGPQQARPEIQWFHHGQTIIADNVHYRIIDEHDTSTLEIIGLRKADAGQVWCVATTSAGKATTTCTINVNGKQTLSAVQAPIHSPCLEMPVRTYRQGPSTQQQVAPRQPTYETQSMYSTQQTSYETSRPTFTKVCSSNVTFYHPPVSMHCRNWNRSMPSNTLPFKSPCISQPLALNRLDQRYNGFTMVN